MSTVTINDPNDQCFPFGRELWENPRVLYHGTWSVYSTRVETEGFGHAVLPFDHEHIAAIKHARELIGIGSYAGPVFFHDGPPKARDELSMTGNFWHARAYATDGGGEVVRIMLKEARDFEDLCLNDDRRLKLKAYWESGLKQAPGHGPTLRAVELLGNCQALQELYDDVRAARENIEAVTKGGFAVVYAIRVEPHWFNEAWERYEYHWARGFRAAVELRCRRDLIQPPRILAKAVYPNGTDSDFLRDGFKTWDEVEALRRH